MSKKTYLVFTNNMMPRLLTNPLEELLATFSKDQVIKNPDLRRFRHLPLQHLVLENKEIKKASKEELGKINSILDQNKNNNIENKVVEMNDKHKELEVKLSEIKTIFSDQEKEYKEKIESNKNKGKWKALTLISLAANILCIISYLA